jgi:hypothetical protein
MVVSLDVPAGTALVGFTAGLSAATPRYHSPNRPLKRCSSSAEADGTRLTTASAKKIAKTVFVTALGFIAILLDRDLLNAPHLP